jgi:hypothetical protein
MKNLLLFSTSIDELFDLSVWIFHGLDHDLDSEDEKRRLIELVVAFRIVGFRTFKSVSRIDQRAILQSILNLAIGKRMLSFIQLKHKQIQKTIFKIKWHIVVAQSSVMLTSICHTIFTKKKDKKS